MRVLRPVEQRRHRDPRSFGRGVIGAFAPDRSIARQSCTSNPRLVSTGIPADNERSGTRAWK